MMFLASNEVNNTKVLLAKPKYYSRYPPLGLLKLSAYHKKQGHEVDYTETNDFAKWEPDLIQITSLFTYAWEPVHDSIWAYKFMYPDSEIQVGGIYASLFKKRVESLEVKVHTGLFHPAENLKPDYSLVPKWDSSILFSSRGCVNNCAFCAVPRLEKEFIARDTIIDLLEPKFKKVVLWDNNFLASPYWPKILQEIKERKLLVDFNQGIDARLVDKRAAKEIASCKTKLVRSALDCIDELDEVEVGIKNLLNAGINGRKILVYVLFNFSDTPEDLLIRLQECVKWGICSYPMRYQPIKGKNALKKDSYIDKNWTPDQLEMIAKARRVIGYGGAFIPHEGLKKKFLAAKNLDEAMELRPIQGK
jgi:hypothetical protein